MKKVSQIRSKTCEERVKEKVYHWNTREAQGGGKTNRDLRNIGEHVISDANHLRDVILELISSDYASSSTKELLKIDEERSRVPTRR